MWKKSQQQQQRCMLTHWAFKFLFLHYSGGGWWWFSTVLLYCCYFSCIVWSFELSFFSYFLLLFLSLTFLFVQYHFLPLYLVGLRTYLRNYLFCWRFFHSFHLVLFCGSYFVKRISIIKQKDDFLSQYGGELFSQTFHHLKPPMRVTCRCWLFLFLNGKENKTKKSAVYCARCSAVAYIYSSIKRWYDTKGKIGICVPFERFLFGF